MSPPKPSQRANHSHKIKLNGRNCQTITSADACKDGPQRGAAAAARSRHGCRSALLRLPLPLLHLRQRILQLLVGGLILVPVCRLLDQAAQVQAGRGEVALGGSAAALGGLQAAEQ